MSTINSSSITTALGVGSGIDTQALVANLVSAVREPKETAITGRQTTNNARISALASASSALDTFSTALTTLLSGTGFSGEPVSNDMSIATVALLPGGTPTGLPAQIDVRQLASAQTLESGIVAAKTSTVGLGSLTLTTAAGNVDVTITSTNNTLEGLAAAINGATINGKATGVTASVVTDNQGARLVLKGATGAANAFTLTPATAGADTDLQRFTFDGTTGSMTKKQDALDSIVRIDNVEMHNDSNVLSSAIPYVRIDLNKASPGTLVTLASNQPTTTIRDLVVEFTDAYNVLRKGLNSVTATGTDASTAGALAGDAGTRDMMRQLSRLTSTQLASSGSFRVLADIGISTNRDGTLALDTDKLDAAIAKDPAAVTQMLNPAVSTDDNPGLAGAMTKVRDAIKGDGGALAASQRKFAALKTSLTAQLAKLDTEMTDYQTRLTAVYSKMESQLTAMKATQSYLTQQIAVWNNSSS
ncbi:flagellar filament capping protein FliD [soil metagenome]